MNREQKAAVIDEIAASITESDAVFAVDYRGITVRQVADLRTKLRESDTTFRVVKNTLTERAADQAGVEALKEFLDGPTALAFVKGDAAAAAKTLTAAAKETELLPFKGGVMDGAAVSAADITAISKLPSREVLYGQLVGVVASPITGLARSLNGLLSGLAVALGQVQEKKASGEIPSGDAPAAAAAEPEEAPAAEAVADEAPAAEPEEAPAAEAAADEAPADDAPAAEADADADAEADAPAEEPTPETDSDEKE